MKHYDDFTNLYSLSKTLRFELKPVGKDGKPLSDEDAEMMLKEIREQDKKIKKAYTALKPVMDQIHENIINDSLKSEEAKKISFSAYLDEYKKGKEKNLENIEKSLREKIGSTFENTANEFAKKVGKEEKEKNKKSKKEEKDKPILKEKGIKCLTEAGILKYIEKEIHKLVPDENQRKEFLDTKETIDSKGKKQVERSGHLETFKGFFTYFTGYNQNRENYYEYKKEASTAVATRIVHENLPKFCDNIIQFSSDKEIKDKKMRQIVIIPSRKNEYLNAYQYLKDANRNTQIKDAKTNTMRETHPIEEKIFDIKYFSECLAQSEIEEYNRVIGDYNLLINLYNQAKGNDPNFRKLPQFKTLYKQIGCGKNKALFFELKYDTIDEQQQAREIAAESLSVQGILELVSNAGIKYFQKKTDNIDLTTINTFTKWLKQSEHWDGVYWSKSAVDKVSNQYLANWHDIKDRIQYILENGDKEQKEILNPVASFDKKREEQLKIHDVVELSGLFDILDQGIAEGWSKFFFKESILEDRKSLIDEKLSPSQNLINLICADIEDFAKEFLEQSESISKVTDYKNETNILEIKDWLDKAKSVLWSMKYFEVKESKVKGHPINTDLANMLTALLHADDADWFGWYDAVRNYLTKKPQDDAKKNKLKLNFFNPNLLGGWSDGEEKNKGAVLLKNGHKHYVGLLIDRNIFDTKKKNISIYNSSNKDTGRLILRNIAFKTLAGKGFNGMFKVKYGDIGKTNPLEAVQKLQEFIKSYIIKKDKITYAQKYPSLKSVLEKKYNDKKIFDKEIQEILRDCYENDFTPIDWNTVLKFVEEKKMYLFEVYSKDFSTTKGDKSNNSNLNLQTIYWQNVFQENSTIQLCGGGEIFFREKATDKKIVHPANELIYRRSDGQTASKFKHDIIKDKRFTAEKYSFHIPIKINYQAPVSGIREGRPNPPAFNAVQQAVNNHFTQADDIQFLGIDRGEKHLIYYSLVNAKGEIQKQGDLDVIKNKDYLKEINEAAKIRRQKQENWQQKGNISNLKDGYISLVVHEIIEKMKDENGKFKPTFIVLEDLNSGFKRGRQKFEQQVYQKFELALAKKLNFVVDKKAPMGEIGSVAKALQLTPPITNYQDIEGKKQIGIMLYTRANYTSVTDPVTGWRKTIYLKTGSEGFIKEKILEAFTEISVDEHGDYFFQYKDRNTEKIWTLWSSKNGKPLERYRAKRSKDKNKYEVESIDVKEILDKLFADFNKNDSLIKQLREDKELLKVNEHTAWESLRFVIDTLQQIRNSGDTNKKQENKFFGADESKNQDDNFLLSPIRNESGEHFDSRIFEKQKDPKLPKDADANGAYNIARKGIIMYEHIKQWVVEGKEKSDLDLFISDEEWDLWTVDREQWKQKLKVFASQKAKKENAKRS